MANSVSMETIQLYKWARKASCTRCWFTLTSLDLSTPGLTLVLNSYFF